MAKSSLLLILSIVYFCIYTMKGENGGTTSKAMSQNNSSISLLKQKMKEKFFSAGPVEKVILYGLFDDMMNDSLKDSETVQELSNWLAKSKTVSTRSSCTKGLTKSVTVPTTSSPPKTFPWFKHFFIGDKSVSFFDTNEESTNPEGPSASHGNLHDTMVSKNSETQSTSGELQKLPSAIPTLSYEIENEPQPMYEGAMAFGVAIDEHFVIGVPANSIPKCGQNERYTECSRCEITCTDLSDEFCSTSCGPPKCECPAFLGFAREKDGKCVDIIECESEMMCPENEEWTFCGGCEPTCDNAQGFCDDYCDEAQCQCKTGMLRNRQGKCVRYAECF